MRFILFGLVGLGMISAGVWFFWPDQAITNYPSSGTDIIAFGDSLIVGAGASRDNDFVSLLSEQLGEPIVNLGVNGDTTADGVARLSEITNHDPKVVLVLFGGNDYLRKVPVAETFSNLDTIITTIHDTGAIIVVLGVRGGILTDEYQSEFAKLAKKHNTVYIPDVLRGVIGRPALMADTVHPNDAGYAVIADRIYPELLEVIE